MKLNEIKECLECCPVIPAVRGNRFEESLSSEAGVIFLLEADLLTVAEKIKLAHRNGKYVFIHIDLMHGIGKDRYGVEFVASLGADGIITTKAGLIRFAKEAGLVSVMRCFALDSQGIFSIEDVLNGARPDFVEIMPGVVGKVIKRISSKGVPVIAGGLLEEKQEVISALNNGAFAVSTGKEALWNV